MTQAEFIERFRIKDTSVLAPWRDLRDTPDDETPRGDCQSFGWTVLLYEAGGWLKALLMVLTLRAMIFRCWSPVNGILPRHAVLWVKGKGWIDSTEREWRDSPAPHKRPFPVGLIPAAALSAPWWGPKLLALFI